MSYSIQKLLSVCPQDNNIDEWNTDELCSYTFSTLVGTKLDKHMERDTDWEFKITDVDEENDTVTIEWFIVAGTANRQTQENTPIKQDLIDIMKDCEVKN